jgi:hypothetical protein
MAGEGVISWQVCCRTLQGVLSRSSMWRMHRVVTKEPQSGMLHVACLQAAPQAATPQSEVPFLRLRAGCIAVSRRCHYHHTPAVTLRLPTSSDLRSSKFHPAATKTWHQQIATLLSLLPTASSCADMQLSNISSSRAPRACLTLAWLVPVENEDVCGC